MKWFYFISALLVSASALSQNSEPEHIIVIANINAPIDSIDKYQLRNLYMGNLTSTGLTPIDLPPGNIARIVFNTRVIGLTESRIETYWAQMRFGGRKRRPKVFDTIKDTILALNGNPLAITYLPASSPIPIGTKVIYRSQK